MLFQLCMFKLNIHVGKGRHITNYICCMPLWLCYGILDVSCCACWVCALESSSSSEIFENATTTSQKEIQLAHWSHAQATIITAHACTDTDSSESIMLISDDLNHSKQSVYTFMQSRVYERERGRVLNNVHVILCISTVWMVHDLVIFTLGGSAVMYIITWC